GGANKDHLQRLVAEPRWRLADKAFILPSVGVAAYADVERVQGLLRRIVNFRGQQNRPGAGAEGRLGGDKVAQLLQEAALDEKIQKGARLAAGNNDAVDRVQLFWLAHQRDLGSKLFEPRLVGFIVALDCENTDFHLKKPRKIHHGGTEIRRGDCVNIWSEIRESPHPDKHESRKRLIELFSVPPCLRGRRCSTSPASATYPPQTLRLSPG